MSKSEKFEIISNILKFSKIKIPAKKLCDIAKVSRSGYYNWEKSITARNMKEDRDLEDFKYILNAYKIYGYKKGVDQIYLQLIHGSPQIIINKKKIKRLMKKFNLSCNIRKPNAISMRQKEINDGVEYPYLIGRNFKNKGQSYKYQNNIKALKLHQSMSHKGTCLDNAPVESFFGHMKDEIDLSYANTYEEIKNAIDNYIDTYNNKRYSKELCMLSPSQFYQFIVNNMYPSYLENIFPEKNLKLPKWISKYKKKDFTT